MEDVAIGASRLPNIPASPWFLQDIGLAALAKQLQLCATSKCHVLSPELPLHSLLGTLRRASNGRDIPCLSFTW